MQFGLIEAVRHWAKYRRNEIALVSNDDSITYGALFDRCESVARGVLQNGSNGCVAIVSQRKLLFLSALLGVMRAGRSVIIVNPTLSNEALRLKSGCPVVCAGVQNGLFLEGIGTFRFQWCPEIARASAP